MTPFRKICSERKILYKHIKYLTETNILFLFESYQNSAAHPKVVFKTGRFFS